MKGEISFDEANDLFTKFEGDKTAKRRAVMIITFYFPTARSVWEEWEKKLDTILQIRDECSNRAKRGEDAHDLASRYRQAFIEYAHFQHDNIEPELAKLAEMLMRPEPLIPWRQARHWISTKIEQFRKANGTTL